MFFALPKEYREASVKDLRERIAAARARLGKKLCILAHHYQRVEIVQFGDHVGDSYGLSQIAAGQKETEVIVFCGVHFMAEAADILSSSRQLVYLPNPLAGCPMAEMAEMADVMSAWEELEQFGGEDEFIPISYMNTAANLKAFTGKYGGLICTSSNADAALHWALDRREKAFFFPDENLGLNTAIKMGMKPHEMAVWDFSLEQGGLSNEQIEQARVIVWKGHCHVHTNFTGVQIAEARKMYPDVRVVVHPECIPEVVQQADANGSTSFIVKYCREAPAGSTIAIGTEINLTNRLALELPDKKIISLSGPVCAVCANMYRTTLNDLAYCLDNHEDIKPIEVAEPTRSDALLALQRMLEVK